VLTLREPDPRCDDGYERFVVSIQLVVASGDSSKMLDTTEEALNEVTPFVDVAIKGARFDSVYSRRNHCLRTRRDDSVDQGLGVVGFVGGNRIGLDSLEQWLRFAHVGPLPGCEAPAREVAEGFDQGMDLRCQSATRPANGLLAFFFCAPAAC
jgi:hypothetical protein